LGKYDDLDRKRLIELLEKRDREKKLGLVWERDEIEADKAVDENFIAATLIESLSDRPAPWRNLVIEGDNFDALRWLRMTHAGKVKCIYVDPPYNTGNKDWVYNDNYMDKEDRFRFSTWLEFLFRRFTLARDLLTEDGVVLVCINDENRALMELMLNEAMPGMNIGSFVWRGRTGGNEGGDYFLSVNHEHILIYAKDGFRFGGTDKSFAAYSNSDNHPDGDWTSSDLSVAVAWNDKRAGKGYYPIYNPETDIWYPCNPDRVWGFVSREISGPTAKIKTQFIEDLINEKKIKFPEENGFKVWESVEELLRAIDDNEVPQSGRAQLLRKELPNLEEWVGRKVGFGTPRLKKFKKYLKSQTQPLSSWVVPQSETTNPNDPVLEIRSASYDEGAKVIKQMFGAKAFNYAKPPSLFREIIRQASSPGDIVLDFFAGSATTAQAVMELNAEDGGDRTFIMVSSTEATVDEPDKNICRDITAERVRRLNASDDKKYADLAAGFAYLKTREIDFENIDYDLKPSEAWNALEAIHGLPLTPYDSKTAWNEHGEGLQTLIYADQVSETVFERVSALAKSGVGVTVYSWSPGQLRDRLKGLNVEVQSVRAALVKKFQQ
jgi:adenine-specific DNA-methyltransferase